MPSFSKNKLVLENGKIVAFDFTVKKIIEIDDVVVVLLSIPTGVTYNENIFGVSNKGGIIWQIEGTVPQSSNSPYVDIEKSMDGLDIFNWSGLKSRVNVRTGKVTHTSVTK